jgi:hypothetical protein
MSDHSRDRPHSEEVEKERKHRSDRVPVNGTKEEQKAKLLFQLSQIFVRM